MFWKQRKRCASKPFEFQKCKSRIFARFRSFLNLEIKYSATFYFYNDEKDAFASLFHFQKCKRNTLASFNFSKNTSVCWFLFFKKQKRCVIKLVSFLKSVKQDLSHSLLLKYWKKDICNSNTLLSLKQYKLHQFSFFISFFTVTFIMQRSLNSWFENQGPFFSSSK